MVCNDDPLAVSLQTDGPVKKKKKRAQGSIYKLISLALKMKKKKISNPFHLLGLLPVIKHVVASEKGFSRESEFNIIPGFCLELLLCLFP